MSYEAQSHDRPGLGSPAHKVKGAVRDRSVDGHRVDLSAGQRAWSCTVITSTLSVSLCRCAQGRIPLLMEGWG